MQFSSQTEYSIRILLYLACRPQRNHPATIGTLSDALNINRNYLPKILKPLRAHNILRSEPGSQGGFFLAADPGTITLLDILTVTEGSVLLNPCLADPEPCSLSREMMCPVRTLYAGFQSMFDSYFGSITLSDLAEQVPDDQKRRCHL